MNLSGIVFSATTTDNIQNVYNKTVGYNEKSSTNISKHTKTSNIKSLDKKNPKSHTRQVDNVNKTNKSAQGSKTDKGLRISKEMGGERVNTKYILSINSKKVEVNIHNTPQKRLSSFPKDKSLKQYSSEIQTKTIAHASNLWKQSVYVNNKKLSFIRCGNTRGCEEPAREILANALNLKYSSQQILNATKAQPLELNFSNIQLMTPGKKGGAITDMDMPIKQIEIFQKLAKEKQPLELIYQDKSIFVNLKEPLLFNFPVNAQGFCKGFKYFVDFEKTNEINDKNFEKLFGENFCKSINKGKFSCKFDANSIIGKKLKELEDMKERIRSSAKQSFDNSFITNNQLDKLENEKKQILSLANQIIDIYYHKDKRGLKENPDALPTRVILLTNLLGYATSYGCKSGKDRTGVAAMELENLISKVLTTNEPYDPYKLSDEEQKNLQTIYKGKNSIEMANVSTGGIQKNLKIKQFGNLFTSNEKRFGIDLNKPFDENLKILENNK